MISWKTDGSAGAMDLLQTRLNAGSNSQYYEEKYGKTYAEWAAENGRTNFKYEIIGGDLIITEEWSITEDEYNALDIEPVSTSGLPMIETTEHLSF
jgi:hypothetical protein